MTTNKKSKRLSNCISFDGAIKLTIAPNLDNKKKLFISLYGNSSACILTKGRALKFSQWLNKSAQWVREAGEKIE